MSKTFVSKSPESLTAAAEILKEVAGYKYILMTGDLGAGKTTLVKHIAALMDSEDIVSSPTYTLHNTYTTKHGQMILHSDLYRVETVEELEQTGFFDLAEDADIAFIEWGGKFPLKDVLEKYAEISIIKSYETVRDYTVSLSGLDSDSNK